MKLLTLPPAAAAGSSPPCPSFVLKGKGESFRRASMPSIVVATRVSRPCRSTYTAKGRTGILTLAVDRRPLAGTRSVVVSLESN